MERQRGSALGWATARIGADCLLGAAARRPGGRMRSVPVLARPAPRVVAVLAVLAVTWCLTAGMGVTPSAAASYPLPVKTVSGLNQAMPDPGVYLDGNEFYAFVTGSGLLESKSTTAAGPWSAPVNVLAANQTIPAWMDLSKSIWAPDMIKTTSGQYVVYFSVALAGIPPTNPPGDDSKPAGGSRCIASAESTAPIGPFFINPNPVVCLKNYGAADDMTGDPANRVLGEGVIDPSPRLATIGGQQELFLLYRTQGLPATIRMAQVSVSDGISVVGESHQLVYSTSQAIEAPSLVQNGSWFILFVAHGYFKSCAYSTLWYKSQNIWSWSNTGATTLLDTSSTSGLCGPGSADVTGSEAAGQNRIFFHGWVSIDSNGVTTTTPLPPGTLSSSIIEGVNAARVMYAAVLTFGSDGYTPIIGAYQGQ